MATSGSFTTNAYNSKKWLEFSWSRASYDLGDNSTTINWTLKGAGTTSSYHTSGNFKVVIDGEQVYYSESRISLYAGTVVAQGSKKIYHNADGTRSFSASAEAGIYTIAVNCSGSGSWTLDSLPRQATLTAAPNFNDEGNPTISYTNPAGNAVTSLDACISLTGARDDVPYRAISKTGSSYTFSLTTAERNTLRNATPNSNTLSVTFYVRTVIGGNTFYSTITKTMTITNGAPTLSSTVTDSNSTTTALTGDANKLVKYYSNAAYTIGAAAVKGASVSSSSVTHNGSKKTSNTGTYNAVENATFVFDVKDSRGNTNSKTVTKTLINYVKLTCNQDVRINVDGEATITLNGNYFNGSFGATANTLTLQYRYKTQGGSYGSWTSVTATKSGNTYTATVNLTGFNYQSTYVFQSQAIDKLATSQTKELTTKASPVFDWGENDFAFHVPVTIRGARTYGHNILYDSSTGSTVTLSDSMANYDCIEIYFTDNNGRGSGSAMIYNTTGTTTVDLALIEASSATSTYMRRTAYICTGKTLTPNTTTAGYVLFNGSGLSHTSGTNYIRVTKVIGYR